MNDFNLKEWKEMQEFPFLYFTSKILAVFRELSLLMGVIFVILYACNKIDWSLWFVTLPFWYAIPTIIIALGCDCIRHLLNKNKKY